VRAALAARPRSAATSLERYLCCLPLPPLQGRVTGVMDFGCFVELQGFRTKQARWGELAQPLPAACR
jgi:hypothetical protein